MSISFQFRKHLSLGRGGVILTDDKDAALELKKMSYDGRHPDYSWSEQNISIKRLADMIKKIIKFKGKVVFDLSKPDGVYNKKLDCTKLKKIIKKINNIPLNIGIEKV